MKIYTEVNYEFKDGSLVEQSSKFYNYEGEIAECKSSGSDLISHAAKKTSGGITYVQERTDTASDFVEENTETIQRGPTSGLAKHYADQLYGGDLKKGIEHVQKQYRDTETDVNETIEKGKAKLDEIADDTGDDDDTTDDTTTDGGTILTTPEEREAVLQQGKVAEGGRKKKYGRQFMAGDPLSASSILAP